MLDGALHEAAHLVASCACPRSWINEVEIGTRKRGDRAAGLGRCASNEIHPDERAFVWLVGWAWEKAHGEPLRGADDAWSAARGFALYPYVLPAARAFVERYENTIRRAADEILDRMTKRGLLRDRKLAALVERLRGEVDPFTRPPGGLTPDEALERETARPEWDTGRTTIVRRLVGVACWTPRDAACAACAAGVPDRCHRVTR